MRSKRSLLRAELLHGGAFFTSGHRTHARKGRQIFLIGKNI